MVVEILPDILLLATAKDIVRLHSPSHHSGRRNVLTMVFGMRRRSDAPGSFGGVDLGAIRIINILVN